MRYFGELERRVKIQMTSKNVQRYYTLKCLIRDLLSNFFFSQNSELSSFFLFRAVSGIRRVHISCDNCYSFHALFVLYEAELDDYRTTLHNWDKVYKCK